MGEKETDSKQNQKKFPEKHLNAIKAINLSDMEFKVKYKRMFKESRGAQQDLKKKRRKEKGYRNHEKQ